MLKRIVVTLVMGRLFVKFCALLFLILAWEKEHFGDDTEALKAHYDYCLQVAMGIDKEVDMYGKRLDT